MMSQRAMTRGLAAGHVDTTVGAALHSAVGEAQLHVGKASAASELLADLAAKQQAVRDHTFGTRAVLPQVIGLLALTSVWVGLVLVVFRLDVGLYATARYAPSTALLLGTLVVLINAGLGMILGELLGLTLFLHEVERLRRRTRAVLAAAVVGMFLALAIFVLPLLAASRSAAQFGPQTDADQKVAFAVGQPGADPTEQESARIALRRSQTRESQARVMDQRIAVLASIGDLLFAPAVLRLLGASTIPSHALRSRRVRRRIQKQDNAAAQVIAQLNARLSAATLAAGGDLAQVEQALEARRARDTTETSQTRESEQRPPTPRASRLPFDHQTEAAAGERESIPRPPTLDPWNEF